MQFKPVSKYYKIWIIMIWLILLCTHMHNFFVVRIDYLMWIKEAEMGNKVKFTERHLMMEKKIS